MHRRTFIAVTSAAIAAPYIARAQSEYDPTPRYVRIKNDFAAGSLIVVPSRHFLFWVEAPRKAIRYGVGVGRAGLDFKGKATIDVKKEWPTWRPTKDMISRDPKAYARFVNNDYVQPGGKGNPLGARALYLFQNGRDTYYRIHGTNQPSSIGRSVSNGCIRMLNEHVADLYERVPLGTVVTVV
ncbi:MAG: L,D-transpeptidase [Pseudomonadota bacterium]